MTRAEMQDRLNEIEDELRDLDDDRSVLLIEQEELEDQLDKSRFDRSEQDED